MSKARILEKISCFAVSTGDRHLKLSHGDVPEASQQVVVQLIHTVLMIEHYKKGCSSSSYTWRKLFQTQD